MREVLEECRTREVEADCEEVDPFRRFAAGRGEAGGVETGESGSSERGD